MKTTFLIAPNPAAQSAQAKYECIDSKNITLPAVLRIE
jgi:hypothetical protein